MQSKPQTSILDCLDDFEELDHETLAAILIEAATEDYGKGSNNGT